MEEQSIAAGDNTDKTSKLKDEQLQPTLIQSDNSDDPNKIELVGQIEIEKDTKETKKTTISNNLTEHNSINVMKEEVTVDKIVDKVDTKQILPISEVDANPFSWGIASSGDKKEIVSVPTYIDAKEYNLSSYTKKLIIINQKHFASKLGLTERRGTEHDQNAIVSTFKPLGWDIDIHNDLNLKQVRNLILDIQTADNDKFAALAIFILSHGEDNGTVFTYDGAYRIYNDILSPLAANSCPALAGRPKMIFVQACQGRETDSGTEVIGRTMSVGSRTSTDAASAVTYKIPNYADFLIYQASFCGHYSFRNSSSGSWFIQSLCSKIDASRNGQALFDILLEVSHGIAIDKESYSPNTPRLDMKKQVPLLYSTMIRKIYLKNKEEDKQDLNANASKVDNSTNVSVNGPEISRMSSGRKGQSLNDPVKGLKMNGPASGSKSHKKRGSCSCM